MSDECSNSAPSATEAATKPTKLRREQYHIGSLYLILIQTYILNC